MLSQKFKVLNKLQVFHFRSRTVHTNTTQGRPQDLGGGHNFFSQTLEFACREAPCALLGRFGGVLPREFF